MPFTGLEIQKEKQAWVRGREDKKDAELEVLGKHAYVAYVKTSQERGCGLET